MTTSTPIQTFNAPNPGNSISGLMDGMALERDLARAFHESIRTWQRRRRTRKAPPYIRLGRRVFYRVEAGREWFKHSKKDDAQDIRLPPRRFFFSTRH